MAFSARKLPSFTILPGAPGTVVTSHQAAAGFAGISPGAAIATSGQSVTVPTFTVSSSQWRLALCGIDAGRWAVNALPRGAPCEIFARPESVALAERIILGQSRDVSGVGPQSIVSGWGALSLAISRPQARAAPSTNDATLFANCQPSPGNALALSAPFNFGSHTTLQFASTPPFQKETGRPGAVLVTPSSGTPYIVTWTGISGNDLTGVSTSAEFGTTGSNASSGDIVQEVCWIDYPPAEMARRILVSTGTGTNGSRDTLPESWGLGVPEQLIDGQGFTDASTALNATISSGSYSVHTVSTTPQGPALEWLQTELQRYGLWLCERQGQISIRPALDYWRHRPAYTMVLDSSNLIAMLPDRSNYDSGQTTESRFFTVKGETLSDWAIIDEAPKTRPMLATIDTGPIVDGWPNVYQNQAAINMSIARRVGPWHLRIHTVIECVATLEAAQLCVGDWVRIDHLGLWDHGTNPSVTQPQRPAMVSSISCDWSAGQVSLRLHVMHPDSVA